MLRYFQTCQILPEGAALAEKTLAWSDTIIANGLNRDLWEAGKTFAMEALEKGFDTEYPGAFIDHILDLNEPLDVFDPYDDYSDSDDTPTIPIKEYTQKTGRNQPCPCGSGRKYKKCCGQVSLN